MVTNVNPEQLNGATEIAGEIDRATSGSLAELERQNLADSVRSGGQSFGQELSQNGTEGLLTGGLVLGGSVAYNMISKDSERRRPSVLQTTAALATGVAAAAPESVKRGSEYPLKYVIGGPMELSLAVTDSVSDVLSGNFGRAVDLDYKESERPSQWSSGYCLDQARVSVVQWLLCGAELRFFLMELRPYSV